ncbi:MAG: hypothetical protein MI700_03110 [Balneolales bacterium]|nr:hypothetical protein [Balneolales bacterium]
MSIYERCRIPGDSWNTLENILSYLKIDVHAKEIESKIPHSGATVVVSNHPTGIIDALALATAIRQVRNDIKIVGNHTLQAFEELDELVIPVDPVSPWDFNPINISQLRRAKRWLLQGHLLIVFPAGDVSHFRISKGAIADSDWNDTAIRLAESVDANFVQMFIKVPTDVITHYLGAIHWTFRTSIIIRRLKHWRGTVFRII